MGRNNIEYFVNDEKKICTAVLIGIREDIARTMDHKFHKAGMCGLMDNHFTDSVIKNVLKNVPDKLIGTARCSDLDEFNEETGCAIARAKLLAKLYRYREMVAYDLAVKMRNFSSCLEDYSDYYESRKYGYEDEREYIANREN